MSHGPQSIYARRFAGTEAQRDKVWQILTRNYFQRWVRPTDAVLDVGAGYCAFINNIQAAQKFALLLAIFWFVLGKQFLIVARKPNAPTP